MFFYGKFKEPRPPISFFTTQVDWSNNDCLEFKNFRYSNIYNSAPDFHIYETPYGVGNLKLYIYCSKSCKDNIKFGHSLWQITDVLLSKRMDLFNSINYGELYNVWLNYKENWLAILGLENAQAYYKRTNYCYTHYGFSK